MKRGILLLNLGTPESPTPPDVEKYLKQFLMDGRVIDIAWPLRWFFVNVLIIPKRKYASAEAYEKIWTERGSPLLYHLKDLANEVSGLLRLSSSLKDHALEIAMRYGRPSIESALRRFQERGVGEILVFPLYPQFAESSTLSSQAEVERVAREINLQARIDYIPSFYKHESFIEAFGRRLRETIDREDPDHVLMSFHGLPVRHVRRVDLSGGQHCMRSPNCCDHITEVNRNCYRAQSYATARALAESVQLAPDQYTVSFQSRLGRAEWIPPYTDHKYKELADRGVKKLVVACPSFVADCLETLEEIGIRGSQEFKSYGGERCVQVPCPNSDPKWSKGVVRILEEGGCHPNE